MTYYISQQAKQFAGNQYQADGWKNSSERFTQQLDTKKEKIKDFSS